MNNMIFNTKIGYGKYTDEGGRQFVVLRADGYYSLGYYPVGGFLTWVKENVKRISTLQKFIDERGYGFEIKEVEG